MNRRLFDSNLREADVSIISRTRLKEATIPFSSANVARNINKVRKMNVIKPVSFANRPSGAKPIPTKFKMSGIVHRANLREGELPNIHFRKKKGFPAPIPANAKSPELLNKKKALKQKLNMTDESWQYAPKE